MKFIPYGRHSLDAADIAAVVKVLKSQNITQGFVVGEFEQALSAYCGARYAVLFNSGTAALHAAYFSTGLACGDEFITSPLTFVATANAGLYLGAKPVWSDIEGDTGNIDVSCIEKKITRRTKMLVPVHYAGQPADLAKIHALARKHKLFVVEDACHALGSAYKGEKTGCCRYSDLTVFSFHPVKHITTGEGGAVLTNNHALYKKLLLFRSHGISKKQFLEKCPGDWYYEMQTIGYNYRLTDFQAALGVSQLRKLDSFVAKRRQIARTYTEVFSCNPYFDLPQEKEYAYSSYHLYPIRMKDASFKKKQFIFLQLKKKNIGVQTHYIPVYFQPYYKKIFSAYTNKYKCPVAEDFYQRQISIPIFPALSHHDLHRVIKSIVDVFKSYSE